MKTVKIKLDSMEKIRMFNTTVSRFKCDFDLEQGRYYIDAKSILGILSLDQSAPMQLHFTADAEEEKVIMEQINNFLAE